MTVPPAPRTWARSSSWSTSGRRNRFVVSDPTWLASFNCHRRSTDVYRRGHVLLAGDAVHIHTPAGGQGMNTGITDAHNLGWKLALVAAAVPPISSWTPTAPNASPSPGRSWASPTRWSGSAP